jgi:hypothetical protein
MCFFLNILLFIKLFSQRGHLGSDVGKILTDRGEHNDAGIIKVSFTTMASRNEIMTTRHEAFPQHLSSSGLWVAAAARYAKSLSFFQG